MEEMPNLVTAYNTEKLASRCSPLLLVWAKVQDGRPGGEFLIGQARLNLSDLGKYRNGDQAFSFGLTNLCMSNRVVASVHSKIKF